MTLLRIYAALFLITLAVYTAIVIANHGANLVPVFFGDIAAMAWPGQFNLDFMGFLILSALWVNWRYEHRLIGWVLTPLALFGGMMFLTIYILIVSFQVKGDVVALLIGKRYRPG
ncbi:MAG: hypothetical protein AAGA72_11625 [Pseudomonadota bacterium]